jgi:hypothetical protein
MRAVRLTLALAVATAFAACTGSGTAPSTPTPLRADVADPVGDTAVDARIAAPPDLVRATVTVASQTLTFAVAFAPGTFNRDTTRVSALVDTDLNGSTGIKQIDGVGADYALLFDPAAGRVSISKADEAGCAARLACYTEVASAPLQLTADGMQTTLPLSSLGGADGRMTFEVNAAALVAPLTPVVFDFLPDTTLAPARVQ